METLKRLEKPMNRPVALVLGNFDGFHKGHMTLLDKAREVAKVAEVSSAVFSFEPHPSFVLRHKDPVDLINTQREKEMVFEQLGMDYYFEFPFTMELAGLSPEAFIKDLLLGQVIPHTIIVGEDYRFGKKRVGDVDTLRELGKQYGFDVIVMPKMLAEDKEISSTWIRKLIASGDIAKANKLIGRPFFVSGIVKHGAKIGRTIGFPTANVIPEKEKLLPPYGVYKSKVKLGDRYLLGMTYIGDRPTIDIEGTTVETNIFDFDEDIYDREIQVDLLEYIRGDIKFDSLEALKDQIALDSKKVRS